MGSTRTLVKLKRKAGNNLYSVDLDNLWWFMQLRIYSVEDKDPENLPDSPTWGPESNK